MSGKPRLVLSPLVQRYVKPIVKDSPETARAYGVRLMMFDRHLKEAYGDTTTVENIVQKIMNKEQDVYDLLFGFREYLEGQQNNRNSIRAILTTIKVFLVDHDVVLSDRKYRQRVRPPKKQKTAKKALDKPLVRTILQGCQNKSIRLFTWVLLMAGCGFRPLEALKIRTGDVDLENGTISLSADDTKTDVEILEKPLTKEVVNQLRAWDQYRRRERRIVDENGEYSYVTREFKKDDLFFATGRKDDPMMGKGQAKYFYHHLSMDFAEVMDSIGLTERYNNKGRRHRVTPHRFRDHCLTTVETIINKDFAEWYISHGESTYWNQTKEKQLEMFHKIEPYLTYLDYNELEAKGADTNTRVEQLEKENQALKEHNKYLHESLHKKHEQIDSEYEDLRLKIQQFRNVIINDIGKERFDKLSKQYDEANQA